MNWESEIYQYRQAFAPDKDQDWAKTEELKCRLADHFRGHPENGLSRELFEAILDWKLRRQRGRTEGHRNLITDDILIKITKCVFTLTHPDKECLAKTRMAILQALPGIGVGVASAILALTFPETYAVIDYRVWKIIYDENKRTFTPYDYEKYLRSVWASAENLKWQPQEVDFFTWKLWEKKFA